MQWEIVRIPGNPSVSLLNQPTVDVVAAVVEPKLVNTLVRHLSQVAPLEDLRHVKRVCKRSVQGSVSKPCKTRSSSQSS